MSLELEYHIREGKVVLKSPVDGAEHAFHLDHFEDFLDWLSTERKNQQPWGVFVCAHIPSLRTLFVLCENQDGQWRSVLELPDEDADRRLSALRDRFNTTKNTMLEPVKRLMDDGVSADDAVNRIESRYLHHLKPIWQREPDETE